MNKRYIDFVPVDKRTVKKPAPSNAAPRVRAAAGGAAGVAAARAATARVATARAAAGAKTVAAVKKPAPLQVRKGAPRRMTPPKPTRTGVASDVPLGQIFEEKPFPAGVTVTKMRPKTKTVGPDGPLITKYLNTDKIEKRPLSNTYKKRAAVTPREAVKTQIKETQKKTKTPERIILKPEKDSKAGMIIAVILTIILGAAAGTVAFLLLPK